LSFYRSRHLLNQNDVTYIGLNTSWF